MDLFTKHLNSIGLIIDIAGALMVFFNSPIVSFKTNLYGREEAEKLQHKALAINRRASMGMLLIAVGCMFQLISNLIKK